MSCIYERCALFGIMGAGLVGAIAPNAAALCRHGNLVVQRYADYSWREHTMIQLHPSPFQTCDFAARFPTGCRWINGCRRFSLRPETVQYVSGSSCRWRCRNGWWDFAAYLLVAILVIVAQPSKRKTRSVWSLPRQVQPTRNAGVLCLLRIAESFHVYG